MKEDAILVFNGHSQSIPLNEYPSGRDDHDDTVTVANQICESVVHSEKPIIDPVLTFAMFDFDSSPLRYMTNTLVQFYAIEELTRANDILWDTASHNVIGVYTKRRDGSTRSVSDIIAYRTKCGC